MTKFIFRVYNITKKKKKKLSYGYRRERKSKKNGRNQVRKMKSVDPGRKPIEQPEYHNPIPIQ